MGTRTASEGDRRRKVSDLERDLGEGSRRIRECENSRAAGAISGAPRKCLRV